MYDWLLFLGMSGARGETMPVLRLSRLAELFWNVGGVTVLGLGIWLAIYLDGYDIFDGWIVAAIVLWLIASGAGARVAAGYREALGDGNDGAVRTGRSVLLHAVMAAAVLALLVDMILKPGAS